MNSRPAPSHYRGSQIFLHWVVVLGVVIQIAIHESIVRVNEALGTGETPVAWDVNLAWVHVGVGTTILVAVVARLYLRYRYGAPGHAPGASPMQARLANFMHWGLYAALLGMVITGMITWNGLAQLGDIHFIINVVMFFMILGHAAAAIYNQVVRKDGTLRRMLPAQE